MNCKSCNDEIIVKKKGGEYVVRKCPKCFNELCKGCFDEMIKDYFYGFIKTPHCLLC